MGPLQRTFGRRDGALHRRPDASGPLRRRRVEGRASRGRHRSARHGVDPCPGDRVARPGHAPTPRIEIESEVDRYISYPAQALAYMVGRREIFRLRQAATDRLGSAFDLREFHDVILRAGSLPLPALAATVERWMERAAPAAVCSPADAEPMASHPSTGAERRGRPGAEDDPEEADGRDVHGGAPQADRTQPEELHVDEVDDHGGAGSRYDEARRVDPTCRRTPHPGHAEPGHHQRPQRGRGRRAARRRSPTTSWS